MKTLFKRLKTWAFRTYYRLLNRRLWKGRTTGDDIAASHILVPTRSGEVVARMYHGAADKPLLIYFHGGGWVIGDLDTHDPFCRSLCHATGLTLVSIDYRLAPEHPFPAAHEDCEDASRWIIDNLNRLAPNNGSVILGGDSAGGNLTAASIASLAPEPRIVGALMIYPATEHYFSGLPSYQEHAKTGPLTSNIMRWFMDTYLGDTAPADPCTHTIFVGRRTDYRDFPPTLIVTAERDPLRDDGKRLITSLKRAGVSVTAHHYADEAHGFACSEGPTKGHRHFVELTANWLAEFR